MFNLQCNPLQKQVPILFIGAYSQVLDCNSDNLNAICVLSTHLSVYLH